jgi:hypothetical protein
MKNLILVLLANAVIGAVALGQCVTNPAYATEDFGIWPDTIDNLPCGLPNTYYETVVQFKMPTEAAQVDSVTYPPGVPINWIRLDNITGLPTGMTYLTDAASSSPPDQWNGGEQGCVTIMGQSAAGTYPISIDVTGEVVMFGVYLEVPLSFGGYEMILDPSVPVNTITASACGSYSYGGNTYDSSGTYMGSGANPSGCDTIVTLNLTILQNSSGTDTQTACDSYTWIDSITYTASNNTATYTLPAAGGCDSVVTLDLTIDTVDIGITFAGPTLTANATSASYQWLDCDNNYTPIAGETNQSFTATTNGSYAVAVTQNNCTDTSGCASVTVVGLLETRKNKLQLYPNPTTGILTIDGAIRKAEVYDIYGRLVRTTENNQLDLSASADGIYFVHVIDTHGNLYVGRVVKE